MGEIPARRVPSLINRGTPCDPGSDGSPFGGCNTEETPLSSAESRRGISRERDGSLRSSPEPASNWKGAVSPHANRPAAFPEVVEQILTPPAEVVGSALESVRVVDRPRQARETDPRHLFVECQSNLDLG